MQPSTTMRAKECPTSGLADNALGLQIDRRIMVSEVPMRFQLRLLRRLSRSGPFLPPGPQRLTGSSIVGFRLKQFKGCCLVS